MPILKKNNKDMKKLLFILMTIAFLTGCSNRKTEYTSYDEYPVYTGNDLGLIYNPSVSKFRVWAPTADEVKLLFFNDGLEGSAYEMLDMKKSKDGTWIAKVDKDLKGKFYTYQVRIGEKWLAETPDIYAKAVGVNGNRAAIVDMNQTNPTGWENDKHITVSNMTDAVIYEVHIRDFSVSPTSGITHKGKYLAFTEDSTKNSFGQSTGIEHLKELGITHVHLLPAFDYASIDETKLKENKYNWGYDPKNYNAAEGSYATNAYLPEGRIKEFKQMVQALHNSGIGVIMDVVYNHTYVGDDSHLNQLVPGYYYRFNDDGSWSNASGCGNETASERPMMRKFMIESVLHWVNEYHIDGFRFDLMGIHDIETMNEIRSALDDVNPNLLMYGEGWTAARSPLLEEKRAVKKNVSKLNRIAVFSDDIRDAIKGNWMNSLPGFVSGTDSLENAVKFGVVGSVHYSDIDTTRLIHSTSFYANNPTQIINYASCHDDMCLVDKLRVRKPTGATEKDIERFNKLAQTIVFTSQGIPFIYAGEELYRNKKGVNNTYQSPDSINQINWDNKQTYNHIFSYYKELIALRKAHPAFRMTDAEMMRKHLQFIDFDTPNIVAFLLKDNANGDSWKDILVILNGNRNNKAVILPEGKWNVVAHDGTLRHNTPLFSTKSSRFIVGASSASIMWKDEKKDEFKE